MFSFFFFFGKGGEDAWKSIPSPVKYSQDGVWQSKSSWTVHSLSTNCHGWLIDRWNTKTHLKDGAPASSNWYPSPSPLSSLHLTPSAPPLQPSSSSPLSPYVYESVTMATSPQGQKRRVGWGGYFRSDKQAWQGSFMMVCLGIIIHWWEVKMCLLACTSKSVCLCAFELIVCSILTSICGKAAL